MVNQNQPRRVAVVKIRRLEHEKKVTITLFFMFKKLNGDMKNILKTQIKNKNYNWNENILYEINSK